MPNRSVSQYLSRYAEPETELGAGVVHETYRNALIIPCFDEPEGFLDRVLPSGIEDVLVIVVANSPVNAAPEAQERTVRLIDNLTGNTSRAIEVVPFASARNVDLLVIDRARNGRAVPARQGVGLARKIGSDIALSLHQQGLITSPWLYSTDADATLPTSYFTTDLEPGATNLFPFHHESLNSRLHSKGQLYETYLRYYVNRLRYAGSPYAYHTLGSTLAIPMLGYAQVRGFPKRSAGEDFYLLNKLAKVAPIHSLHASEIKLQSRESTRVPFGTGPAIANMPEDPESYLSYAPESFDELNSVLENIGSLEPGAPWRRLDVADRALETLGFFEFLDRAHHQFKSASSLQKAIHQWLDAFRTLRFIHEIRKDHPDRPLLQTMARLFGPSEEPYCQHLKILELEG